MTRWIRDGFADCAYEPVADTFLGLRAFRVATVGRRPEGPASPLAVGPGVPLDCVVRGGLRGVFMSAYQWGDGVNEAMCLRGWPSTPPPLVRGKPHSLLLPDCDCGFWVYTNGDHVLSVGGPAALGIVEGWGRMVLGPDGFRAEKARIRALAFPSSAEATLIDAAVPSMVDSWRAFSNALDRAFAQIIASLSRQVPAPVVPPKQTVRAARPWENVDPRLRRDVQRAYPSARVYTSVATMLREFPPSDLAPLLPEPEQPEVANGEAAS